MGVPGGAEYLLLDQARCLKELAFDVELLTFFYRPSIWEERVGDIPVRAERTVGSGKTRVTSSLDSGQARWAFAQLPHYDMVITHNYPCSTLLGHSGFSGRTLWYCHEPPRGLHPIEANPYLHEHSMSASLRDPLARQYRWQLLRWRLGNRLGLTRARLRREDLSGVARIDEVWANSEFTKQNVLKAYGHPDVKVVYPGVRFPEQPRWRSGVDRSGLQVLCLTRLEPIKNVETVIRGFSRFLARAGGQGMLHVVGEGPRRARLEQLCKRLGVERVVRFYGFVNDAELDRIAARCDVFALLPIDEPFGMVFPEAAARGLLMVGPDHGGPLETLEGGALGEIAEALSPEALAEALLRLWRLSDEEVEERRIRAFRSCEARFSFKALRRRMEELLPS
jgi:glycosyltransferase involved in cell wall biosynthesis